MTFPSHNYFIIFPSFILNKYLVYRELCSKNYVSSNKYHFQDNTGSNRNDPLPEEVKMRKSGFVRDVPRTLPTYEHVKTAVYNPEVKKSQCRSQLYKIQHKDPVENENNLNGPSYMSTENHTRYLDVAKEELDAASKTISRKEDSGFTHACSTEPITYKPPKALYNQKLHSQFEWAAKPSIMQSSFQSSHETSTSKPHKLLSKRAERDTGYTREIKPVPAYAVHPLDAFTSLNSVPPLRQDYYKKNDPAEYINLKTSKQHPSITASCFQGKQPTKTIADSLNPVIIGRKEDTGFTENNCIFVETFETPELLSRFNTQYQLRYYDKNPSRHPVVCRKFKPLPQAPNGFTKSTKVQISPKLPDKSSELLGLHPYAARSIKANNPYFSDSELKNKSIVNS